MIIATLWVPFFAFNRRQNTREKENVTCTILLTFNKDDLIKNVTERN